MNDSAQLPSNGKRDYFCHLHEYPFVKIVILNGNS